MARCPLLVFLALSLTAATVASGYQNPPKVIAHAEIPEPIPVIATDGAGVYLLDDLGAVREWTTSLSEFGGFDPGLCAVTGLAVHNAEIYLAESSTSPQGCPEDKILVYDLQGNLRRSWCPRAADGAICQAQKVAVGPEGRVVVASAGYLLAYDSQGLLLATGSVPERSTLASFTAITIGPDGRVYVLDTASGVQIWTFDRDLDFLGGILQAAAETPLVSPLGIAVGPGGYIYVSDIWPPDSGYLFKLDPEGNPVMKTILSDPPGGVAVDADGYVYAAASGQILKYDNQPQEWPFHPRSVALHVAPVSSPRSACDLSVSPADLVTEGEAGPGVVAYVYMLAGPIYSDNVGLTGLRTGIEYTTSGLQVFGWTPCGTSQAPQAEWPGSGSGNSFTWTGACPQLDLIPVGYFYLGAYAPGAMAVVGYPGTPGSPGAGEVTLADCGGAEYTAPSQYLGWVSLGGGARDGLQHGCNPFIETCLSGPVPVRHTTWGQLKSRY